MSAADITPVDTWIFDLDNTLYHPSARLFDQIEVKMVSWIMRELGVSKAAADALRTRYWSEFGTTLSGLMAEHQIEPWEFLMDVHDIDFNGLSSDPELLDAIHALPGRRIVFTNGDTPYAARVLEARGLEGAFDAVYGIEHTGWRPKPHRDAFDAIIVEDGLTPTRAIMFEDDPRNLAVPHELGMHTVHVGDSRADGAHIHHSTRDLTDFLSQITVSGFPTSPQKPS